MANALRCAVVCVFMAHAALPTSAQTPPATPVLPRPALPTEPPPALRPLDLQPPERAGQPAAEGVSVRVERFGVSGNTLIGSDAIGAVLQPYVARTLRFDELSAAADAVTALYRRSGFLLALAYLPAQQIRDGVVEIAVLEGRLGELRLGEVPAGIDRGFLASMAQWRIDSGAVVAEDNLVRNLLVLSELPGLTASADVRPGAAVGTADVLVDLRETGSRLSGVASLDNHGGAATGRTRFGLAAAMRQLLGRGDSFDFQASLSPGGALRLLQAGYALPVHASGTRLSASLARLDYRVVTPAFAGLDAKGDANYLQLALDQPLVRSVGRAVTLRAGYARKNLSDRVEAFDQRDDRHIDAGQLTVRGEHGGRQPETIGTAPGTTTYTLSATAGRVSFDDDLARTTDALQRKTSGRYARINLDLAREQPFAAQWSVYGRLAVQAALHRNLDSAERAVLGGAGGLRAYGELASQADSAEQATLELRWRAPSDIEPLSLAAFVDLGHGRIDRVDTPGLDNSLRSTLFGLSAEAALPYALTLRVAATRQRMRPALLGNEGWVSRGWLELVKAF